MSTAPAICDPNEVVLKLTGLDYLSYSAISTFQRCPLRYYFAYVAGLEPEFKASSLVFGGAIHAAIEHHCRTLFEGQNPPDLDAMVAAYEAAWKAEAKAPVRFGKAETADSLRDLAQRMLAAFQAHEVSKMDTTPLSIEDEVRSPVVPGCPDILGRLDLVTVDSDSLRIVDFKTSRSRWSTSNVEEAAPQMLLYSELVRPLAACYTRPVCIEWVVITKAKQPTVEIHPLQPDQREIERVKTVVQRVWQAIAAGNFYPAPSAMGCAACPYATACRNWEG